MSSSQGLPKFFFFFQKFIFARWCLMGCWDADGLLKMGKMGNFSKCLIFFFYFRKAFIVVICRTMEICVPFLIRSCWNLYEVSKKLIQLLYCTIKICFAVLIPTLLKLVQSFKKYIKLLNILLHCCDMLYYGNLRPILDFNSARRRCIIKILCLLQL